MTLKLEMCNKEDILPPGHFDHRGIQSYFEVSVEVKV